MSLFLKQTKIVATLGKTAETFEQIKGLSEAGMNVARFNFSHGDLIEHKAKVDVVREVIESTGKRIALLQDLSGPKIRTGTLETETVTLQKGNQVVLTTDDVIGSAERMSISYKKLPHDIEVGADILINDGKLRLEVLEIKENDIVCEVKVGGTIREKRGVNLPGTSLSIPAMTEKDLQDVQMGIEEGFDFVALSFVQTAKDILDLKELLRKQGSKALVIAKIETTDAIENIEAIVHASDAIMVARGDLAVEVGAEKVPALQKRIVRMSNKKSKPVIVATQMLESMTDSPVPTRAEVSDVSNAITDGADAVMLSQETAYGNYAKEAVEVMCTIAQETERSMELDTSNICSSITGAEIQDAITRHAVGVAVEVGAKAIVALTESGTTSRQVARLRSGLPVLVVSPHEHVLNQSLLSFGTYPSAGSTTKEGAVDYARQSILKLELAKPGERVIMTSGSIFNQAGHTNTITVITI